MRARTLALVTISSLATVGGSSALASQSETETETVVGFVASVDGDLLVLTNVPTVAPGRVFKLGGGQMFIAGAEGGEGAAEPADSDTVMVVRGDGDDAPLTPENAAAVAAALRLATQEAGEVQEAGEGEAPRRIMVVRSDDPEGEADAAVKKEEESDGGDHVMFARSETPVAGGMWMSDAGGGEELAVTDEPLELQELRLSADVEGRDYLIPGLRVRLHIEGEGEARVVTRVELLQMEVLQQ